MLFHAKNSVSNATPCYFGANNWHQFGANYCRCAPYIGGERIERCVIDDEKMMMNVKEEEI